MNATTAKVNACKAAVDALVAKGQARIDCVHVLGLASDGTWVSLGDVYDTRGWLALADYLSSHPTPDTW